MTAIPKKIGLRYRGEIHSSYYSLLSATFQWKTLLEERTVIVELGESHLFKNVASYQVIDLFPDAGVLGQGCIELNHDSIQTILQKDNSLTDVAFLTD